MASPAHRNNFLLETNGQDLRTFYVFHVNRNAPDELNIDTVQAPDGEEARRVAERLFPTNAILQVRLDGKNNAAPDIDAYPSARFINGQFHSTDFNEDELELG